MRILVAPDKFKGSLGASAVAEQIGRGLRDVLPHATVTLLPIADGGEGTAEIICAAAGGDRWSCKVQDALGRSITARYCCINGDVAVMDVSAACGLSSLPASERNPDVATSFGVGELMRAASADGVRKIIVGLGGSSTNDGGFGMARALGFRFYDDGGEELRGRVSELCRLHHIERPECAPALPKITAAADVRNALLGPRGATQTFALQKGATPGQLPIMEAALKRLADVSARSFGSDFRLRAGAGAAGGLGFALATFCGATIERGFQIVAESVRLEEGVRTHDIVITGEGRLEEQTAEGKAPAGVAELARKHGKRIYALVGQLDSAADARNLFDGVYPLVQAGVTLQEAMREAAELLRQRAAELAREL